MSEKKLLTKEEVADLLRMPTRRVSLLANRGKLPHVVMPNGEVLFDEEDLLRWIDSLKQSSDT